jgi:DNA polymerase-3 subunit delta
MTVTLAWLVTGKDAPLVNDEVSRLVARLLAGVDRSLALEDFTGLAEDAQAAVVGSVVDACSTPPFLTGHRVVLLREAGHYKADQFAALLTYLESPLPTTRLVVVGGGESGAVPAKVAAAFRQSPVAEVVGTEVAGREVHGWVGQRVAETSIKLTAPAAALMEDHLGEDLGRLGAVLAALEAAYGPGANLDAHQVEPYLGQAGSVPPWDLTDAIDKGDHELALALLHRFMEAGSRHPLVVLAVLHRHFNNILRAQSPDITSEAQVAQALKIPTGRSTFPARKALDAARRMGPRRTGDAITALADAELALKGKLEWDGELVLEVLVARLCRLAGPGQPARAGTGARTGGGARRGAR